MGSGKTSNLIKNYILNSYNCISIGCRKTLNN